MKLELKTLAPYLPYGLKIRYIERNETHIFNSYNIDAVCSEQNHLKPILRPLSDLTKEIEVNGEKFVPIVELSKIAYSERKIKAFSKNGVIYNHLVGFVDFDYNPEQFSFVSRHYNKEMNCIGNFNVPNQLLLFNKLFEWHFNVLNLPENLYVNYNNI